MKMKQMLKDTIIIWIVLILALASICIIIGVPFIFITYAGIGEWQVIACALWLLFWLSFVITFSIRKMV